MDLRETPGEGPSPVLRARETTTTYLGILPPTTRSQPVSPPLPPGKVSEAPAELAARPGGLAVGAERPRAGAAPGLRPRLPAAPGPSAPAFPPSSTPASSASSSAAFHHIRTEGGLGLLARGPDPAGCALLAPHSVWVRRPTPGQSGVPPQVKERAGSAGSGGP